MCKSDEPFIIIIITTNTIMTAEMNTSIPAGLVCTWFAAPRGQTAHQRP